MEGVLLEWCFAYTERCLCMSLCSFYVPMWENIYFNERRLETRGLRALIRGPVSLRGSSAQMTGASKSTFE